MGENFLQMLMGMVDSYLVAHLGILPFQVVSVAGNIITIYQAIFLALGAAVASVMSKSLGEKKSRQHCLPYATESLKVTLLLSALLGGASLLFGRQMISLLGRKLQCRKRGDLPFLGRRDHCSLGLMTTLAPWFGWPTIHVFLCM